MSVRQCEVYIRDTLIAAHQFTDVNAFLTLAATSHLINEEDIDIEDRVARILESARSGKVPVKLCTGKIATNRN